jgi:putative NADPH-quinone reductase
LQQSRRAAAGEETSTAKRVAIIQGRPTLGGGHFCHALADAYARGVREAGQEARMIVIAELGFPLLRGKQEWESEHLDSLSPR